MIRLPAVALGLAAALLASAAQAAEARREPFGTLSDGVAVESVVLSNGKGVTARIITVGAALQSLVTPDRQGRGDEITLGYDTAAEYLAKPNYFGASVGRYANRIKAGRFALDGRTSALPTNDGPNHLHGGPAGFDKKVWRIAKVASGDEASVTLTYRSPDGEAGYPGTLDATVTYSLNERNELKIAYGATTDQPTVVNLTNHSFFNLAGERAATDILDQRLTLKAARYTPVDPTLIPTGELRPVAGGPFDFRTPTAIGARVRDGRDLQMRLGRGYDHNFVVDGAPGALRSAALLEDPISGRRMELLVTAPGLQVYSGNFLDGTTVGRGGRVYRQSDGLCLEPQVFPDSPNQPTFPSARLNPGETYANVMVLRFSTAN
jgi:aldose 1-epimerase